MKLKFDSLLVGFLIGLACPLLILYGVKVFDSPQTSFLSFLDTGFEFGTLSPILKLAALFNLAPFFYFINENRMKICQGIVFATILCGLFIIYFTLR
jgi:hypothetical protein